MTNEQAKRVAEFGPSAKVEAATDKWGSARGVVYVDVQRDRCTVRYPVARDGYVGAGFVRR